IAIVLPDPEGRVARITHAQVDGADANTRRRGRGAGDRPQVHPVVDRAGRDHFGEVGAVSSQVDPHAARHARRAPLNRAVLAAAPFGETTVIKSFGAWSSLRMVPFPCTAASVAFTGLLRFTKNVSSGSKVVSPSTLTLTVCAVAPGAKVPMPLAAT